MTRYSDAALLKGDFATMLKDPPKEAEWKKVSCENGAEEAAQSIAKQIFAMQQQLDPQKHRLEVITFSSIGPIKVMGLVPIDGDLIRIDGLNSEARKPVTILQHVEQLSLTFTVSEVTEPKAEGDEPEDDGAQIGFVIFDELNARKKSRDAAKRKKPASKTSGRSKAK